MPLAYDLSLRVKSGGVSKAALVLFIGPSPLVPSLLFFGVATSPDIPVH